MQRGATLSWVSASLAVNAFIHIQQLHLGGGSDAQSLCWKAEPFFFFQKPLQNGRVGCARSPGSLGTARPTL